MRIIPVLLLFTSGLAFAQKPIRVDVNLVNISYTVRDPKGALVKDLSAEDFDVFEDGVAQKISFFARSSEVPLKLGLVVDFSGSQEHFVKEHHHDLKTFLDEILTPKDRVFLLCFGNRLRLVSELTNSPDQILDGLHEFEKGSRHFPEFAPDDTRELGTAFYDAVYYSITERLSSDVPGRSAIILFSDGEDNSSSHHLLEAIETAQSHGTLIFGMRYTEMRHGHPTARNRYGTLVMSRLAQETGAADYDAQHQDIRSCFKQIADQLRTSYELAYHSTNPRDGTYHKIVIRPKNPEYTVRAKTGYYAR